MNEILSRFASKVGRDKRLKGRNKMKKYIIILTAVLIAICSSASAELEVARDGDATLIITTTTPLTPNSSSGISLGETSAGVYTENSSIKSIVSEGTPPSYNLYYNAGTGDDAVGTHYFDDMLLPERFKLTPRPLHPAEDGLECSDTNEGELVIDEADKLVKQCRDNAWSEPLDNNDDQGLHVLSSPFGAILDIDRGGSVLLKSGDNISISHIGTNQLKIDASYEDTANAQTLEDVLTQGNNAGNKKIINVAGLHVGGTSDPGTDNLIVDGDIDISADLRVTGDADIDGDLDVDGTTSTNKLHLDAGGWIVGIGNGHFSIGEDEETWWFPGSGGVGIGTADPGALLDLKGTAGGQDLLRFSHSTSPASAGITMGLDDSQLKFNIKTEYSDDVYDTITIDRSTRNIGIGTSNPSSKLEVEGNISANAYCDGNGNNCKSSADMLTGQLPKIVTGDISLDGGQWSSWISFSSMGCNSELFPHIQVYTRNSQYNTLYDNYREGGDADGGGYWIRIDSGSSRWRLKTEYSTTRSYKYVVTCYE